MTSKERVYKAIKFKSPDRIPVAYDLPDRTMKLMGKELQNLMNEYPQDYILIRKQSPYNWTPKALGEDEWGCVWEVLEDGFMGEVKEFPIKSIEDIDNYKIPNPLDLGWFDKASEIIEENKDKYIFGDVGLTLFERMHLLCGLDKCLEYLMLYQDKMEELADKILEFQLNIIEQWRKFDIDGIYFTDDWGMQDKLIINPELWRKVFKPRYKILFDEVHKNKKTVFFHSCGNIEILIPDFIELGLDIISPVQAMNINNLSKYKGKICFAGGIDAQHILHSGSTDDVVKHIKEVINCLNDKTGGYIALLINIMPNNPIENIKTVLKTV